MNWLRTIFVAALALAMVAGEVPAAQKKRPAPPGKEKETPAAQAGALRREGAYWVQEETATLLGGSRLEVVSSQGEIELRGGAQPQITYRIRRRVAARSKESAERALATFRTQTRRVDDKVYLMFSGPPTMDGQFSVIVPKGLMRADIHTLAGGLLVEDIAGELHASTGGGAIEVDRIGGLVELRTGGGPIAMGAIGGSVRAQTDGGDVRLISANGDVLIIAHGGEIEIGKVFGSVQAQTSGGEIHVVQAMGNVTAESAAGHITIGEAGIIQAATNAGAIRIDKARNSVRAQTQLGGITVLNCLGPLQAQSAAGSITAHIVATRSAWAQSFMQTTLGDIRVFLPRDLAFNIQAAIEAATRNQSIVSDFPLTMKGSQNFGPRGITGMGSVNGGGPQLDLRTVRGIIEIRSQR